MARNQDKGGLVQCCQEPTLDLHHGHFPTSIVHRELVTSFQWDQVVHWQLSFGSRPASASVSQVAPGHTLGPSMFDPWLTLDICPGQTCMPVHYTKGI